MSSTSLPSLSFGSVRDADAHRCRPSSPVKDFLDLSLPMKGRMVWDFENKYVIHRPAASPHAPLPPLPASCSHRLFPISANSPNSQLYDPVHNSCINSISRPLLSSTLLSRAQAHPRVSVHFERKIGKIDWEKRVVYLAAPRREGGGGGWTEEGKEVGGWDSLVGGDGAWSVVRAEMMKAQA